MDYAPKGTSSSSGRVKNFEFYAIGERSRIRFPMLLDSIQFT
jgi:hypothetical protein